VGRLLDDPGAADTMGAAGRRFVESWASPAAVAASYEELFAELAARRAMRGSERRAFPAGLGRRAGATTGPR
jgi:putative colanic acid biosynthesis glycosyltransferase WcaI